jgi:hypothetical protein
MNTVRKIPNGKGVSTWSNYNRALPQRGALTVYLGDDVEQTWREGAPTGSVGRPEVFPDAVILLGLVFQQVYRLPLRQTVGLLRSVLQLAGLAFLPVPDPSTLCRRSGDVVLPAYALK